MTPSPKTLFAVVLGLFTWAAAVRAEDLQEEISRKGFAPYLEELIEGSSTLKSAMTPEARIGFSEKLEVLKSKKMTSLNARVLPVSEFYQFSLIYVELEDVILTVEISAGRQGKEFRPYSIQLQSFPGNVDGFIDKTYYILPKAQPDRAFIQEFKETLEAALKKKDLEVIDEFERKLFARAGTGPSYIRERIASIGDTTRAKQKAIMKSAEFGTKVHYVATRAITDTILISVFLTESSFAPAAFTVVYTVVDGKPLVATVMISAGESAMRYLPDIEKAYPAEK